MFKIKNLKFADKGFYINLEKSKDRKNHIEKLIERYKIENLYRFEALQDKHIQYSCTKSHLAVFKFANENNYKTIFVAEDDMNIEDYCFMPNSNEQINFNYIIKNIHEQLQNIEWDVVLFGCNPKTHLISINENLAINSKSTGAWAYLIKQDAYQYILNNLNYYRDYLAIDDFLPLLNDKGFITLTTIPMMIKHGVGFESTLQPNGPVNYDTWINGNYDKFYNPDNFLQKNLTIVIVGHFIDDFLFYLNYLIYSLPEELLRCKFLIHYDDSEVVNINEQLQKISAYLRDKQSELNVSFTHGFGGLISSVNHVLDEIKTPYYLFLEHDWVFLNKNRIDFKNLITTFNKYDYINAVWFSKDDNSLRGFDIAEDKNGNITPFKNENRIIETHLITTCRWSNNPVIFRLSKMKEWFSNIISNEYIGAINQGQYNVEETMIAYYRKCISENNWNDIKDDWGTYLYGEMFAPPYVGHTDASKRYQGNNKSSPEINGENFIINNPIIL